jgi:O-antigen/teichoic acid export membrane protein
MVAVREQRDTVNQPGGDHAAPGGNAGVVETQAPLDDAQPKAGKLMRRLLKRYSRRAMRAGAFALSDQSLISGVNFVTTIVAARVLGPAAFGLFALHYLIMEFVESFQSSLITLPLTTISASKTGDAYPRYISSAALMQGALAVAGVAMFLAAAAVIHWFSAATASMLLALAVAATAFQMQEFTRRVLFAEARVGAVMINDGLVHGLRLTLLGLLLIGVGVTVERLFLILGISYLAGTLLGFWQIRGALTLGFDRGVVREHWQFGNWLCASRVLRGVPNYATAALLASTLSVGAYGAYRACAGLVEGATNVPVRALNSVLHPQLARDAQRGRRAIWRTMLPIVILSGVAFSLLAVPLIVLREPLVGLVFGPEYVPFASVMLLLALIPLVKLQENILTDAFLAFGLTRTIFMQAVIGSVVGITLGGITFLLFGLPAAGAVSLLGALASVAWLGRAWRQQLAGEEQSASVPVEVPERLSSRLVEKRW